MRHEVTDAAILMRLREHFAKVGRHFRRPGRDRILRAQRGAWFILDDAGVVQGSAAAEGRPEETMRELARRLGLLQPWEK